MTIPRDYAFAARDFERFLGDLEETSYLATQSLAYDELRAVFHVFRRHATPRQVLAFAAVLPPVLKAVLVEGWDIEAPIAATPPEEDLAAEIAAGPARLKVPPATAVAAVASTLRHHVDAAAFDRVMATLPEKARAYWRA